MQSALQAMNVDVFKAINEQLGASKLPCSTYSRNEITIFNNESYNVMHYPGMYEETKACYVSSKSTCAAKYNNSNGEVSTRLCSCTSTKGQQPTLGNHPFRV